MREKAKAADLLARYPGMLPVDVDGIAEGEGLEVVERPFQSVEEVLLWPCVGVKAGLPRAWRRWVVAHALGHHMLHRGNQLWFRRTDEVAYRKQEAQAERFAAWLLIPDQEVARLPSLDLWQFAEHFDVPPECVALRFPR